MAQGCLITSQELVHADFRVSDPGVVSLSGADCFEGSHGFRVFDSRSSIPADFSEQFVYADSDDLYHIWKECTDCDTVCFLR